MLVKCDVIALLGRSPNGGTSRLGAVSRTHRSQDIIAHAQHSLEGRRTAIGGLYDPGSPPTAVGSGGAPDCLDRSNLRSIAAPRAPARTPRGQPSLRQPVSPMPGAAAVWGHAPSAAVAIRDRHLRTGRGARRFWFWGGTTPSAS
ncbi:hypothetical protein VTO73DRAFT_8555 [Trametes versicolor]